jgi:uncharacterized protein YdeI (BOF family)
MKCALIVSLAFLLFVAMALAQNSATETQPKTPPTASQGAGAQLFNVNAEWMSVNLHASPVELRDRQTCWRRS